MSTQVTMIGASGWTALNLPLTRPKQQQPVCPFQLVFQHTPMSPPERMLHNSLHPISQTEKYGKQHYRARRLGRAVGEDWWCRLRNARTTLRQAKDQMKQNADKNRTDRTLEVGDFALLLHGAPIRGS